MRAPTFEEYLLLYVSCGKPSPRTDTIVYLHDQIRAGFFPGPYKDFPVHFGRYIQTIPEIHFRQAGKLYRDYRKFLAVRRSRRRRR